MGSKSSTDTPPPADTLPVEFDRYPYDKPFDPTAFPDPTYNGTKTGPYPVFFLSHGHPGIPTKIGGKLKAFFLELQEKHLKEYAKPKAILIVSAHWATENGLKVSLGEYIKQQLDFPAFNDINPTVISAKAYKNIKGSPELSQHIISLLKEADIQCEPHEAQEMDHGAWIPLMIGFPKGDIPVVQLSMNASLNPEYHYKVGRALAKLSTEGVLIICSGHATHNLSNQGDLRDHDVERTTGKAPPPPDKDSQDFDIWLTETLTKKTGSERKEALLNFEKVPSCVGAHPPEKTEHFTPIFIAYGAAEQLGELLETTDNAITCEKIYDGFCGNLSAACWKFPPLPTPTAQV